LVSRTSYALCVVKRAIPNFSALNDSPVRDRHEVSEKSSSCRHLHSTTIVWFTAEKTELIHLTRRKKEQQNESINMDGRIIEAESKTKLMGVGFDQEMRWKEHVQQAVKKATTATQGMSGLRHLRQAQMRQVCQACMLPKLDYASTCGITRAKIKATFGSWAQSSEPLCSALSLPSGRRRSARGGMSHPPDIFETQGTKPLSQVMNRAKPQNTSPGDPAPIPTRRDHENHGRGSTQLIGDYWPGAHRTMERGCNGQYPDRKKQSPVAGHRCSGTRKWRQTHLHGRLARE
jgi:hypothetical protein